jgi:porin
VLAMSVTAAHADVDPCACSPNKPGFHRASALTGDWAGVRKDLFEDGVKVQATYAGEVFTDDDGHAVNAGLGALAVELDGATLVGDHAGTLRISSFAIHGEGLSTELREVLGVSNNVAENEVRLFEAWYEQPISEVTIRAGLLAADQEFVLADHGSVLIGATFGIPAMFSVNIGAPVYPVATPGASARLEHDALTLRAAAYAGDARDDHGIPRALGDDVLAIGEASYAFAKLGAWHHSTLGNGYYAIADDQLGRYLGAFARSAVAFDAPLWLYADAGVRIGPGPLRPRDFFSMGLAFARTNIGAQTIVEATYQALVKGWLTVQPDVQMVLTRDGTHGVLATRIVVAL